MRRSILALVTMALVGASAGSIEAASLGPSSYPENSFQFRLGGFFPQGSGQVWDDNERVFTLDRSDFNDGVLGFSYVAPINNHFEIGFNLDYYDATVRSAERDFLDEDGFPILHDTRLRLLPATVDFRLLPAGRYGVRGSRGQRRVIHPVPYLGAGGGFEFWRYEEVGDFVDPDTLEIFFDRGVDSGTTMEAHAVAGLELPVGPAWSILLEGRYSWASVTLGGSLSGLGDLELDGASAYVGAAFHF